MPILQQVLISSLKEKEGTDFHSHTNVNQVLYEGVATEKCYKKHKVCYLYKRNSANWLLSNLIFLW